MATIERRNGAQWQSILAAQEQSGLSAKAYCREKGIGLASFYSWRKRLGTESAPAGKRRSDEFIELTPTEKDGISAAENSGFEAVLDLGGGISMTLRRG